MPSMRHIKRRIRSVHSTKQITNAMKLVSASKLTKAKARLEQTRPYFNETKRVISEIVHNSKGISHVYLDKREVKNALVLVITGDRGLCGGYNSNVSKEAFAVVNKFDKPYLITVGNKGKDFFTRRGFNIHETFSGLSENPTYDSAVQLANIALDLYKKGEVDEVYLAYTQFVTTINHNPMALRILPVETGGLIENKESALMSYEPSEEEVLDEVIPAYIKTTIYGAMIESTACEQGARMTAMDSATDNATDMIDRLTLLFNRARQGAITQEITEIISGSNVG